MKGVKKKVLKRGFSANGNLMRAIRCRAPAFVKYLKDNRAQLVGAPQETDIVPFADDKGRKPADIASTGRALHGVARASKPRGMAACSCAALGWTVKFARITRVPPAKWSKEYAAKVETGLLRAWANGEQVVNLGVQSCTSKSAHRKETVAEARGKAREILAIMRRIVAAAPKAAEESSADKVLEKLSVKGFPHEGYTQECAYHLMRAFGLINTPSILPTARGTAKGLAELTGESVDELVKNKALVTLRLDTLATVVKEEWASHGPRMKRPLFEPADLVAQLCEWIKDGAGTKALPVKTIALGR